jgi:coenzyme F420-reducing hydrogenase gamma subunit
LENADIIELNKDHASRKLTPSRRVQQLSRHIVEDSACSACYGSLIYALERLDEKGLLNKLNQKLYIGQNFKNKKYDGLGIGTCTSGFDKYVKGCPPKARDIVEYLEGLIFYSVK